MQDAALNLMALPLPMMFFILLAGAARALGVLFGLWGLYFVLGPSPMLRMVIAVVISLPAMMIMVQTLPDALANEARLAVLTIPVREMVIGFSLGLLASLPFFAILGAGIVIDQYRGDFSPGLQAPENQQVASYANLKVVMALFLFVEAGGFMVVIQTLYDSFKLMPPGVMGGTLGGNFGVLLSEIIQSVFWLLITVAMPIMVILFLIEFGLNIILRLAKPIELPQVDFLMKSLVFVLAMPVLVIGVARAIDATFAAAPEPLLLLEEFISE